MSIWTLQLGTDTPLDPASLGLEGFAASFASQAVDTLSFRAASPYDADPIAPYGTRITLYRDGVPYFVGTLTGIRRQATGEAETMHYTVSGPWWQLEQITYEQSATRYIDGAQQQVVMPRSVLGTAANGSMLSAVESIEEALSYALGQLDALAQFKLGSLDADVPIPTDEVNAITVAELIRRILRWLPDRVVWFNYATSPVPSINILPRSALNATTFAIVADATLVGNSLNPRNDLQRDGVVVTYERLDNFDGEERRTVQRDEAGTTSNPLKTLRLYLDLLGGSVSYLRQQVRTATIQASSADWWKARHPKLSGATAISVANHEQVAVNDEESGEDRGNDGTVYTRELLAGSIADWMQRGVCQQIITADVTYTPPGGSPRTEKLRLGLTGTNALTAVYKTIGDETVGEAAPVGLASAILGAISSLQYDGSIVLTDAEVSATPWLARRINLSGGRTEWDNMGAQVQAVNVDIDRGQTTIRLGPAKHLAASDLLAIYRAARERVPSSPAIRTTSKSGAPNLPAQGRNNYVADDGGGVSHDGFQIDYPNGTTLFISFAAALETREDEDNWGIRFPVTASAIGNTPTFESIDEAYDDVGAAQSFYYLSIYRNGKLVSTGGVFEPLLKIVDNDVLVYLQKIG